ncbi:hypothetical protein [Mucilaginibacter agri]|uniref:Uncharacterized protein n=1 Tax=Mucilaginibacter agri TaxID=2695265 RepID=A0A966DT48_9SPHI|nr:hypothetical protein [Mucilaginibacter agri]NCD70868.1 hypothetical protein [Mucilaginibacter agri]
MNASTTLLQSEKEYTLKQGWKIFIKGFALLMFAGAAYCLYLLTQKDENPYILLAIAIPVAVLAYWAWLDTDKNKIILTHDSIARQTSIKRKELAIKDIKGYRTEKDNVFIKPISSAYPKISISGISYWRNSQEIQHWLQTNLIDLDSAAYEEELQTILEDTNLGVTTEDRQKKLASVKKICTYFNIAGIVTFFMLLVFPKPYQLVISIDLLLSVICIIVFGVYAGTITMVDDSKKNAYPTLSTALFLFAAGLLLRMMIDYDLLDYAKCVTPVIVVSISLAFLFFLIYKLRKSYKFGYTIAIVIIIYSYAGVVALNCVFDSSSAKTYHATILSKHISHGKSTTYYLEISKWGTRTNSEDESVPSSLYNEVNTGQNVNVYLKPGLLNIPWYFISTN